MNRQAAGKKSEIAKFAATEQPELVSRFVLRTSCGELFSMRFAFLDVAQCLRDGNLAASVRSMRSPIRSANWNVLASSEPLPSAKYCAVSFWARKNGRALCRKASLYLAGFATLKLTLEITLDVARLPHPAQFTARFSDPAPWQRTSVTAWHFLQRNSKSGIVLFKTSAPNGERTRLNYSTTETNVKSCKPNRKVKFSGDFASPTHPEERSLPIGDELAESPLVSKSRITQIVPVSHNTLRWSDLMS